MLSASTTCVCRDVLRNYTYSLIEESRAWALTVAVLVNTIPPFAETGGMFIPFSY